MATDTQEIPLEQQLWFFVATAGLGLLPIVFRSGVASPAAIVASDLVGLSELVDPASVSPITASFISQTEDEFIMESWQFVSDNVDYSAFGSTMVFQDHSVLCELCLLPAEIVKLPDAKSNCVGMAALLTSLLRTRISPKRVYMVVGDLVRNGVGGHAWVIVDRGGEWYLLEATGPPKGWVRFKDKLGMYVPQVFFNDVEFICGDPTYCANVGAHT